jgi:hypothetical protein
MLTAIDGIPYTIVGLLCENSQHRVLMQNEICYTLISVDLSLTV